MGVLGTSKRIPGGEGGRVCEGDSEQCLQRGEVLDGAGMVQGDPPVEVSLPGGAGVVLPFAVYGWDRRFT